ncbi:hypothetical protein BH23BAC4_BH23BAC4_02410 [soil metagenome]
MADPQKNNPEEKAPVDKAAGAGLENTTQSPAPKPSNGSSADSGDQAPYATSSFADYELPDDFAGQDWLVDARRWVEDNPALAVVGAVGIGLLFGRLVAAAIPDKEPPSLGERLHKQSGRLRKDADKYAKKARKHAKTYSKDARGLASDASDVLQVQLSRAAEALAEASHTLSGSASEGYVKTRDLAEDVSDAVKTAVAAAVTKKADEWINKVKR